MPRLPKMLVCAACENRFDPRDDRAAIFPDSPTLNACPACNTLRRGRAAWAVWNSCNGVFSCSVAETKESATARLNSAGYFDKASESVVPVVIVYGKPFLDGAQWDHR